MRKESTMGKHAAKKFLVVLVALATCLAALAGCASNAGGGTLHSEFVAETGAFKVTADNVDANAAITVGGAVTIKKGDVLLVSPDLTKGKLQVTLTDKSGKTAFDKTLSGRILDTYEMDEGTYDITIVCKETGTTGSLLAIGANAAEYEQHDHELEEILGSMGASAK